MTLSTRADGAFARINHMTATEAEKILEETAAKLGEYFDHVQIMGTWNEESLTKASYRGLGNWYARQGMAHEFINHDVSQDLACQINEQISRPDEGDSWKTA